MTRPSQSRRSPESQEGDAALLRALHSGDDLRIEAALRTIVIRYANLLGTHAACTVDQDTAKDIVQALFFDLWIRRHTRKITTSLQSYLVGAVNRRVEQLRRNRNIAKRCLRSMAQLQRTTEENDAMESLMLEDAIRVIRETHAQTHGLMHRIFALSYDDNLSVHEIAGTLDISVKTVYKRLNTVWERIESAFIKEGHFEPHEIKQFVSSRRIPRPVQENHHA